MRRSGQKLIGLGAPARGVVILNYCKFGPETLEYVIDDTVLKQGKLIPGMHVPVKGWEALDVNPGASFLLLSWNYEREILSKLKSHIRKGTVLIPFPEIHEISLLETTD